MIICNTCTHRFTSLGGMCDGSHLLHWLRVVCVRLFSNFTNRVDLTTKGKLHDKLNANGVQFAPFDCDLAAQNNRPIFRLLLDKLTLQVLMAAHTVLRAEGPRFSFETEVRSARSLLDAYHEIFEKRFAPYDVKRLAAEPKLPR